MDRSLTQKQRDDLNARFQIEGLRIARGHEAGWYRTVALEGADLVRVWVTDAK